jgi:hypothetical protein
MRIGIGIERRDCYQKIAIEIEDRDWGFGSKTGIGIGIEDSDRGKGLAGCLTDHKNKNPRLFRDFPIFCFLQVFFHDFK